MAVLNEELLTEYACGALGKAGALLAATQCAMRPDARAALADYERVGAAMLSLSAGEDLSPDALAHALERLDAEAAADEPATAPRRIAQNASDLPAPLAAAMGCGLADVRWRMVMPGMSEAVIAGAKEPDATASLIRLKAGRAIPCHGHTGREITLVLRGAFEDATGRYEAGDVAVADETMEHRPQIDSHEDCVCLSVSEGATIIRRPVREFIRYFLS